MKKQMTEEQESRLEGICYHTKKRQIVSKDEQAFVMEMAGFPLQKDATAAANKLADWMERMAAAIKEGEFEKFSLNEL